MDNNLDHDPPRCRGDGRLRPGLQGDAPGLECRTVGGVPDTLPVRDGCVHKESMVWWRCEEGPELVKAGDPAHWINIRCQPQAYQLTKPAVQIVYKD